MEELLVTAKQHKLLKNFQRQLEECYKVEITMPKPSCVDSDMVFILIRGAKDSRDCVKKFLFEKVDSPPKNIECKENVDVITLSDSEEDTSSSDDDTITVVDPSVCSKNASESSNSLEESICIIESRLDTKETSAVTRSPISEQTQCPGKRKRPVKNIRKNKKDKKMEEFDESICVLNEVIPHNSSNADFIPLWNQNKPNRKHPAGKSTCSQPQQNDESDIIVAENSKPTLCHSGPTGTDASKVAIEKPLPVACQLRPIVIDGSNVAMAHGKVSRCFSVKGIQLAIEYFMKRGHTQVTAFVPQFRRSSNPKRLYPTKDCEIFKTLEAKQLVVFTPSRWVNGKHISSYDDRFIVQLAATNGGIILSNDNYRDLLEESETFKEAIEQRLLMFCFVGDVLMIPEDPLGRNGPKLSEFLCFPPKSETV